jgi:CubicO group peptidase (beta-lactamase class C family)
MSGLKSLPDNKKIIFTRFTNATKCLNSFIDEKLFKHKKNTDNYSNIGYILLGAIIEKITNLSYLDAYKYFLFVPMKMKNTNIGETNITLYSENCKKLKNTEINFRYFGLSAGGLYSTINDLINFSKNIINLLDKKSLNTLNKIYITKLQNPNGDIGHSGKIYGSHCRFYFTPNKKIYIRFTTCVTIKKDIDEYYSLN